MPEEQVTIIIVAKDSASKVFKSMGDEAKDTEPKIKSLGEKLKDVGKQAKDLGKKMSIGVTAPLAAFAAVSVNSAIKAERLTNTLEGLAGGSEQAATYIKAIKDASLQTIPQVQALEIANKALSFGVVKNAEEMADLTEIAIALGRAQGLDAATAVSDLTTALSRQSPMILDNLGITLKLSEAYKIYADKLGISVDALNESQKAEAFREAALIKGMEVVDKMGGLQDDAAASGERMKAQVADLSLKVGQMLVPVMSTALGIIGPIVQGFLDMSPAMQKTVVIVGALAAAAGPLLTVFGSLAGIIGGLPAAITAAQTTFMAMNPAVLAIVASIGLLIGAYIGLKNVQDNWREGSEKVTAALDTLDSQAQQAIEAEGDLSAGMLLLAQRAEDTNAALHKNEGAVKDLVRARVRATKEDKIWADVQEDVEQIARANASTYAEYTKAIITYNMNVSDSKQRVDALTQAEWDLAQAIQASATLMGTGAVESIAATAQAIQDEEAALEELNETRARALIAGVSLNTERGVSLALEQEEIEMIRRRNAGIVDGLALSQRLQAEKEKQAALDIMTERNARINAAAEDTRAAAVQRAADATARARDAANEYADAQGNLMQKLTGATEEIFKQAIFAEIDPHEIGIEAYADLGVELGILDENSAALAESVPLFVEAIKSGQLPIENADEAIKSFYDSVQTGAPDFEGAMEEFGKAPEAVDGYTTSAGEALQPTTDLSSEMGILYGQLVDLTSQDWNVNVNYTTSGTPPTDFSPPSAGGSGGGTGGTSTGGGNKPQGTTINNNMNMTVSDPLTAAMLADQIRQKSFTPITSRMS